MGKLRIKQIHAFATEVASAVNDNLALAGVTDAIAAEATIARAAEEANSSAISTELVRAVAAEETLSTNLVSEAGTARAAEEANSSAISTELVRAVAAEGTLSTNLVSEAGTARAAEEANSSAISAELVRATGVEGDLSAEILTEKGRLDILLSDADGTLDTFKEISDFITTLDTNDISGLIAADNGLSSSISSEVVRATTAEEANSSAISTELVRAVAAEGTLSTDLVSEAGTARAAEEANSSAISTELVRATGAEEANSNAISTELVRATGAEGELSDAIAALGAVESIEQFAFEVAAEGFKAKTAVQVGAEDELDIFVNGLQVHRADQSGDALARAAAEGWVSADGIEFTVQNLDYPLDANDHIIISGKKA